VKVVWKSFEGHEAESSQSCGQLHLFSPGSQTPFPHGLHMLPQAAVMHCPFCSWDRSMGFSPWQQGVLETLHAEFWSLHLHCVSGLFMHIHLLPEQLHQSTCAPSEQLYPFLSPELQDELTH